MPSPKSGSLCKFKKDEFRDEKACDFKEEDNKE